MAENDELIDIENQDEDDNIVEKAISLYKTDKNHWDPIYTSAKHDLDFLSDDPSMQWPDEEYQDRLDSGKAALTIDYLTQFVHQVANNIRMNTPSINPIPAGSGAQIETAKMLKGLIRKIEYNSCADAAYDNGATSAVKCSIGFVRVDHDFVDDDSEDQELKILKVINPFLIFMDSESIESDGRDQHHCNVLEMIKVKDFRKKYPDNEVASFDQDSGADRSWNDEDEITLSEFFVKETTKKETIETDRKKRATKRTKTTHKIWRYKLSGKEVLEKTWFPGEYIPVVPFYGEEAWNNGKRRLHSLIRKSKPAQYMFNLMQSVEAEILLKQPIAPIMTPAGLIENYADDWKNPSKAMALRYDSTDADGNPIAAKPERLMPPQVPTGIVQASQEAIQNIKATMGIYDNTLGQKGQEVSGRAINARKIQGDVATFHYGDNAVRSITQVGRIIVCAAGEIYDTPRTVSVLDDEDKSQEIGLNGLKVDGQKDTHDLSKGKYDVRVITGASFTTRRQESASFYEDLIKTDPEMMKVAGDLLFSNMDIEGAQQMAARMKKIIPPQLLDSEDGKEQDPQVMALQKQLQQAQQIIQAGAGELQKLQQQVDEKNSRTQIDMMEAQTKAQSAKIDGLVKMMKLGLDSDKNDIDQEKNAGDLAIKAHATSFDQMLQMITALDNALAPQQTQLPPGNTSANNGGVLQGNNLNV